MPGQELTSGRPRTPSNVTIEDARIFYKNFSGREGQYNQEGDRNFGCALPADVAQLMQQDGWNVKFSKPREEGDIPEPWIPIAVSFRNKPPRVVVIARKFNHRTGEFEQVRTTLTEDLVGMLDYADMAKIDLIINPYPYNFNGRSGIKAYLQAIYVTIAMDALEEKYAAIPEVGADGDLLELTQYGEPSDDIIEGEIVDSEEEL